MKNKNWTKKSIEEESYQRWVKSGRKGETETYNINMRGYECKKKGGTYSYVKGKGYKCTVKSKTNKRAVRDPISKR